VRLRSGIEAVGIVVLPADFIVAGYWVSGPQIRFGSRSFKRQMAFSLPVYRLAQNGAPMALFFIVFPPGFKKNGEGFYFAYIRAVHRHFQSRNRFPYSKMVLSSQ
jgi:hypothetical protein